MSFTKNLGRFEDDMRTLREKRTQPGWSFCEYFMVQVPRKRTDMWTFDFVIGLSAKKEKQRLSVMTESDWTERA